MPNPQPKTVQKVIILLQADADENERRVSGFRQFAKEIQALAEKEPQQAIERK